MISGPFGFKKVAPHVTNNFGIPCQKSFGEPRHITAFYRHRFS